MQKEYVYDFPANSIKGAKTDHSLPLSENAYGLDWISLRCGEYKDPVKVIFAILRAEVQKLREV